MSLRFLVRQTSLYLGLLSLSLSQQSMAQTVTFETVLGSFDVELLDDLVPGTVENFLNYVERGDYDGTFFHRSVPGFVIQGGGFYYDAETNTAPEIRADPPITNEFRVSNTRGTVAMAKLGDDPNSATNQWFINLADNSSILNTQNGGFTVFGRVLGDGMDVVDEIAALPRFNLGGAFSETPLINFQGSLSDDVFVRLLSVTKSDSLDSDGDGIDDASDPDDDNDGTPDDQDDFPTDPTETTDTDNDNIGNNADTDDDGDGLSDSVELSFGLDPLDPNDITGSPREIFWRNANDGQNVLWRMESQHRIERDALNTVADPAWQVIGMADFTGDGMDDIFFRQETTGENRLWQIENGSRKSSDVVRAAAADWTIIAMADFDADGDTDLMWRNSVNGLNRYWEMDGTTRLNSVAVRTVSLDWTVVGSGDFDGDGRNDLFWRSNTGANTLWLMQGESLTNRISLPGVGSDWSVQGIGDFDADGMDDVLWHNQTSGANSIWLLDGDGRKSRATMPTTASGWEPFGVIDMNGDGMADVLWRNSNNGTNRLWLMNGTTRTSSLAVRAVSDQNWVPVAVGNTPN